MDKTKLIVLIMCDYYLPGYKAGGPVITLSNVVNSLKNDFFFKIMTRSHDFREKQAYTEILINKWQKIYNSENIYLSRKFCLPWYIFAIINNTSLHILYLNSFFSPVFTLTPLFFRKIKLFSNIPVILAPRGEFSNSALKIKKYKKLLYIKLVKLFNLHENIIWQASSKYEMLDILNLFGKEEKIIIVPDLSMSTKATGLTTRTSKKTSGSLKVIFLSRIDPMKNLDGAIKMLYNLKGNIEFSIYGPISNMEYWKKCTNLIQGLPENVQTHYYGPVSHDEVLNIINKHDLFFLPTNGENFGHVIFESFIANRPVLISNLTPWRNLEEKELGWDIPLSEPNRFEGILQMLINMNEKEYQKLIENVKKNVSNLIENNNKIALRYKKLFNSFT